MWIMSLCFAWRQAFLSIAIEHIEYKCLSSDSNTSVSAVDENGSKTTKTRLFGGVNQSPDS